MHALKKEVTKVQALQDIQRALQKSYLPLQTTVSAIRARAHQAPLAQQAHLS